MVSPLQSLIAQPPGTQGNAASDLAGLLGAVNQFRSTNTQRDALDQRQSQFDAEQAQAAQEREIKDGARDALIAHSIGIKYRDNPEKASQLQKNFLQRRSNALQGQGRDNSHTKAIMDLPFEQRQAELLRQGSVLMNEYPGGEEALKESLGLGKESDGPGRGSIGKYNPRDYTVDSWARFMESRDPSVLERYESQRSIDIGGVPHRFDPARGGYFPATVGGGSNQRQDPGRPGQAGSIVTPEEVGGSQAAVEAARRRGLREVDKEEARGTALNALRGGTDRAARISNLVEDVLPRVNSMTAGFGGAITDVVPGSPAHDLKKDISTIQALVGFDELQRMREMSKTGGALGQVTERELAFLQSVIRNVENSQSPDQLKKNLKKVQEAANRSWENVREAYERDYGPIEEGELQSPSGGDEQGEPSIDDLVNQYAQ